MIHHLQLSFYVNTSIVEIYMMRTKLEFKNTYPVRCIACAAVWRGIDCNYGQCKLSRIVGFRVTVLALNGFLFRNLIRRCSGVSLSQPICIACWHFFNLT